MLVLIHEHLEVDHVRPGVNPRHAEIIEATKFGKKEDQRR